MCMSWCRVLLGAAALFAVASLSACNRPPAERAETPAQTTIERGRVLVTIGGCHDCHSPKKFGPKGPEPDPDRLLSGHPEGAPVTSPFKPSGPWSYATNDIMTAWSGPWGISFAANLTPDTNTGLRSGVWTEEIFIKAMRTGKHMGTSRDILPPMPWPAVAQMSDDDLRAIWAYLGTIPPITNHVPDPIPPSGPPPR